MSLSHVDIKREKLHVFLYIFGPEMEACDEMMAIVLDCDKPTFDCAKQQL